MHKNKRVTRPILLILTVCLMGALVAGCATVDLNKTTPDEIYRTALVSYDKALKWYTKSARTYEIHYQAAPAAVQADWKARIDPIFLDAKDALDAWWKVLSTGDPGLVEGETWDEWVTKLALTGLDFLERYEK